MHYFDPNVAAEYGIAEAVIINHFQFWIKTNKRKEINEHDGRTWTYTTVREMAEWFDYLSEKQIWLAISKLVDAGVLMKGNYNKNQYDRTTWYAFTLEDFWIKPEGNFHFPKRENPKPDTVEPIPDDLTNKGTDKEQVPAADAPGGPEKKPTTDPPKQKPRTRKPAGAEKDTEWQRWVDAWFDFFKARHGGTAPMFDGAQSSALKKLRQYLCKVASQIEGRTVDDAGFAAWTYILDNWDRLREWLQEQFDLTVVHKKINDILNSLRNGSKTNRGPNSDGVKPGTSQQRVDAVRNY